ncbi:(2Fe-2S)-binding protein [Sporosarcina highlanderae]|uniref:(2Fe-2S)-binding protein n=1 Tax=Sporosarcina highlanderae TaxID=3035916 RepID=A0ABT8JR32_9BACL|nr:(2Fe-2S)-binding protein [Sporosarcina highlanderae]MDN4607614.1 (2Fe-2S)-binding protein [Sporosarcina highlanderae]
MISSNTRKYTVVSLLVNGVSHDVMIRSADTLLYTLREQLGLTGAKYACGNGDCGACTVLVNGKPMHSCLTLAIESINDEITTIESMKHSDIRSAFVANWAIQCGYCTPGFILNCHALVNEHPDADDEIIEEWLKSNLCRCTGYQEIKDAVKSVLEANKLKAKENSNLAQ